MGGEERLFGRVSPSHRRHKRSSHFAAASLSLWEALCDFWRNAQVFEETINSFSVALMFVEQNVDTTHQATPICFNLQFRHQK